MAQGALGKYRSINEALWHLVEHSHLLTPFEFVALAFHVERSRFKASDPHSANQAMQGIRSKDGSRFIRGPAGLSHRTWYRANVALEKRGFLSRIRRKNRYGKDDPTEYSVVWPAITAAIEIWERDALLTLSSVCQTGRVSLPESQSQSANVAESEWTASESACVADTSQSQKLHKDKSVTARARTKQVRESLARHTGEAVRSDRLVKDILEKAADFPVNAIDHYIHDFCESKGHKANPALVRNAIVSGQMATWARDPRNLHLLQRLQREAEIAEMEDSAAEQLKAKAGGQ